MNELLHDGPQWVSIKTLLVSQHMDTGHQQIKSVYIYLASLTWGGRLLPLLGDIKGEALLRCSMRQGARGGAVALCASVAAHGGQRLTE